GGPTASAARHHLYLLFVIGWLRHPLPRLAANWAVGAYVERVSGRILAGGRAVLAQAQTRHCCLLDCLLVLHLWCCRNPDRVHDRCVLGRWQRDHRPGGRAAAWTFSWNCVPRDSHQGASVFVCADRPRQFRTHSLGSSLAKIGVPAKSSERPALTPRRS